MAVEGWLEGREQTRALVCAGREGCLREGAVLCQELVEMMDHHQQSGEGLGVPGGVTWHSLLSLSRRAGTECCGFGFWARV